MVYVCLRDLVVMSMRLVRTKERTSAGNIYCDHCKPAKVDAVYRKVGFADHKRGDFSCEAHKHLIRINVERELTEADHQTWMQV